MAQRPHTHRAFTLLELICVLGILAVLAAIAAPRYASATIRYRAEAAARRIRDDLARVRTYAKTTGASFTVSFDATAASYTFPVPPASYTVPSQPGAGLPGNPTTVDLADEPYGATIVSVDFNGQPDVTFNGFGVVDRGGTVVVRVGSFEQTVTLNAETGRATVP